MPSNGHTIEYMIISLPRCRSTWLANLFTFGDHVCLHDPLAKYELGDIPYVYPNKRVGIADTAIFMMGVEALNSIPCKKIIIHRDIKDIRQSLGIHCADVSLSEIDGMHVAFDEIDACIKNIWEYCLDTPFDQTRYDLLKDMNVQPHFKGMTPPNQDEIRRFVSMIQLRT